MASIASQIAEEKQPQPLHKADIWLRVVGQPKKGNAVYGMGSLSSSCLEKSTSHKSSSSSSISSAHPSKYVQTTEFQNTINELVQKAVDTQIQEVLKTNERLTVEVSLLTQKVKDLSGSNPPEN